MHTYFLWCWHYWESLSLSVDIPIAQFIFEVKLPVVENDFYRDFFRLFNLTEVYAHGTGVALILLGLVAFQPARWAVPASYRPQCLLRGAAGRRL